MQRLKSSITGRRGEGWEGGRGEGGGKGEREKGERRGEGGKGGINSNDSSICERNLKCTQYDARHCLRHIFTEVFIDC